MSGLRRMAVGQFHIKDCATLEDLRGEDETTRLSRLLPVETLFAGLPLIKLPAFFERLCRNGCEIYQSKMDTTLAIGERVRLCDAKGNFFGIGEVKEYPEGSAIKMIKLLVL